MSTTGSAFVQTYGPQGFEAWEAAAIALAREDGLTPFPWVDLPLSDATGNSATLRVMTDVIAIGPTTDFIRLPLRPATGQAICNLHGWLLPTPWLAYQMFHQAQVRIEPIMLPNLGASLKQYAVHSAAIDAALAAAGLASPADAKLRSGLKKHVVVSNIAEPKKVIIFGWYHTTPDTWPSNGIPYPELTRQPIQPNSNAHGDFYVDYSHGFQPVHGTCIVNGKPMATLDLYTHPTLSALVSREGLVRVPRYPASVAPPTAAPGALGSNVLSVMNTSPGFAPLGLDAIQQGGRR